jgi:DNA-binding transcriptional ArsR family regulator
MMANVDLGRFTEALADDTRRDMLTHLCCVWLSVNDLVEKLGGKVKQPTVSHHLKKLEEAHLVSVRQEGRHRFYTLNQEYMTVCCRMLMRTYAPDYRANIVSRENIHIRDN